MPILHRRKLRLRKLKETVQGLIAIKWLNWDLNPGLMSFPTCSWILPEAEMAGRAFNVTGNVDSTGSRSRPGATGMGLPRCPEKPLAPLLSWPLHGVCPLRQVQDPSDTLKGPELPASSAPRTHPSSFCRGLLSAPLQASSCPGGWDTTRSEVDMVPAPAGLRVHHRRQATSKQTHKGGHTLHCAKCCAANTGNTETEGLSVEAAIKLREPGRERKRLSGNKSWVGARKAEGAATRSP